MSLVGGALRSLSLTVFLYDFIILVFGYKSRNVGGSGTKSIYSEDHEICTDCTMA